MEILKALVKVAGKNKWKDNCRAAAVRQQFKKHKSSLDDNNVLCKRMRTKAADVKFRWKLARSVTKTWIMKIGIQCNAEMLVISGNNVWLVFILRSGCAVEIYWLSSRWLLGKLFFSHVASMSQVHSKLEKCTKKQLKIFSKLLWPRWLPLNSTQQQILSIIGCGTQNENTWIHSTTSMSLEKCMKIFFSQLLTPNFQNPWNQRSAKRQIMHFPCIYFVLS